MLDLDSIKARLAAATPGPWGRSKERSDQTGDHIVCERTFDVRRIASVAMNANTDFIANAPQDIAALVAEVERLRKENQTLRRSAQIGPSSVISTGRVFHDA